MKLEKTFICGFQESPIRLVVLFDSSLPPRSDTTVPWTIKQVENIDGYSWPFSHEKPVDQKRLLSFVRTWLDLYGWDELERLQAEEDEAEAERLAEGPDPDDVRDAAIETHAAELLRAMGRGAAAMPVAVCCGGA